MKKIIILIALSLLGSSFAGANHAAVNIEKAEKVFVKMGMSHKEKMKMLHCLVMLKEHGSAEEAIKAKMAKIDAHCTEKGMDAAKCDMKKKWVAKHIHNCFTTAKFFSDYVTPKAEAK